MTCNAAASLPTPQTGWGAGLMDQGPKVQTGAINILSQALADVTLGPLTRTALQAGGWANFILVAIS